ncbi:MAG TPA: cyclodeaminase/cyclohydrolase family protein [Gaiellaceae bacterium]|nr:cyclodeaminase/cyclohydrolase family protein [Gaiellaceae bacterium]
MNDLSQTPAPLLALTVDELLEAIASDEPLPASGTAAALVAAMAAGLVAKVGKVTSEWEDGQAVAAQARALRLRLALLAHADTEAYGAALAAMRLPRELPQKQRDEILGRTLERAADVPLAIADAAADVADLAANAAANGRPRLVPDAVAAAELADGAARAAALLVGVNLATGPEDARTLLAAESVARASSARARALESA